MSSKLRIQFEGACHHVITRGDCRSDIFESKGTVESFVPRQSHTTDADGLTTLYAYNALGEQIRTAFDLNANGQIDLAGPDRVTDMERRIMSHPDLGPCEEITTHLYPTADSGSRQLISTTHHGLDGLKTRAETFGRIVTTAATRPVNGAYTLTTTDAAGVKTTTIYENNLLKTQILTAADNAQISRADYTRDAMGRVITIADARTGTTTIEYGATGQLIKTTTPDNAVTAYAHDIMGRIIKTTLPDGSEQHATHDAQGRTLKTWGSQTYTTAYAYNAQGLMDELHTFKDGDNAAPQITRWHYDPAGRLTHKEYPDGKGPDYAYSSGVRMLLRIWARNGPDNNPVTTTYAYAADGQLSGITYSDGTPAVLITHDRLGRQLSMTDGIGARANTYRASDLALDRETHTGQINATLAREYDTLGRLIKTQLDNHHATTYTYDPAGRLNKVSRAIPGEPQPEETYTYAYLANSNLIASVTGPQHTVANTYESNRDALIAKENKIGTTTISKHTYTVNKIGQRTQREQTGSAFATPSTDAFAYNTRGEVIGSTNTQRPALNTAYSFDGMGNRLTSQDGFGPRTYTANLLNQYTTVGTAQTAPTYDLDGNMLTDGNGRTFSWDAENRLVRVVQSGSPTVLYSYDGLSRCVERREVHPDTTVKITRKLYDGWNLLAEYDTGSAGILPASPTRTHLWGLDLSGSLQNAGGVGGLLSIKEGGTTRACTFDGNGNISEVIAGNAIAAHYEYDPFGNTTYATGAYAQANPWRFSTKPVDSITGLYYYGYRWYDTHLGRWPNRDPFQERGGMNIYCFSYNNSIRYTEYMGLAPVVTAATDWVPVFGGLSLEGGGNSSGERIVASVKVKWTRIFSVTCDECDEYAEQAAILVTTPEYTISIPNNDPVVVLQLLPEPPSKNPATEIITAYIAGKFHFIVISVESRQALDRNMARSKPKGNDLFPSGKCLKFGAD